MPIMGSRQHADDQHQDGKCESHERAGLSELYAESPGKPASVSRQILPWSVAWTAYAETEVAAIERKEHGAAKSQPKHPTFNIEQRTSTLVGAHAPGILDVGRWMFCPGSTALRRAPGSKLFVNAVGPLLSLSQISTTTCVPSADAAAVSFPGGLFPLRPTFARL